MGGEVRVDREKRARLGKCSFDGGARDGCSAELDEPPVQRAYQHE